MKVLGTLCISTLSIVDQLFASIHFFTLASAAFSAGIQICSSDLLSLKHPIFGTITLQLSIIYYFGMFLVEGEIIQLTSRPFGTEVL